MFMKWRSATSLLLPDRLSLKGRVLSAGSWSLAGNAISYPIRLVSSLLLTRLLVPEMFGVMAIAALVMTGLGMISDIGLTQNIIQSRRGSDSAYLNTAWSIQIIRGFLLWLLACGISLFVFVANRGGLVPQESVYADPHLPYVIAIISFSMVIGGFQSTKMSEASRYLSLGLITKMQIVAQIVGLIGTIGWVFLINRSIWALVAGAICSRLVTTLLSHIWLPGITNRWRWDQSAFHEIIHFGKWIFLSSMLGFFANNADRVLLGGYVDGTVLGIYSIGSIFTGAIVQIVNTIITQVSYPALSEVVRDRPDELKRSLYRFHIVTASFTYFCAGALIISGHALIRMLYDPRYEQAGRMLEILAVALLALPFNLATDCLLARGMPKLYSYVIAIQVAATIVFIPFGFHFFGFTGALWGIVASQASNVPAIIYYQIKYNLFDLSKELFLLAALPMGMIVAEGFNLALGY
jgi:O-antigen/teichoic acid export membrane protein